MIARAFLSDPQILFLDEPTVELDPQIRKFIWEIIRESLCDRVGIIHKGKLIAIGTT